MLGLGFLSVNKNVSVEIHGVFSCLQKSLENYHTPTTTFSFSAGHITPGFHLLEINEEAMGYPCSFLFTQIIPLKSTGVLVSSGQVLTPIVLTVLFIHTSYSS